MTSAPRENEAESSSNFKWNFGFGIFSSVPLISSFHSVLPYYVKALIDASTSTFLKGNMNACVSVISNLQPLAQNVPQVFAANIIEPLPRKMPSFRMAMVIIALLSVTFVALAHFALQIGPVVALGSFASGYFLIYVMFGVVLVCIMDIFGKCFSEHQRSVFFGWRYGVGGMLTFGAGFLMSYFLAKAKTGENPFRSGYAPIFFLATIAVILVAFTISVMREPPATTPRTRRSALDYFREVWNSAFKKDRPYRLFVIFNCLAFLAGPFSYPFQALFMKEDLGISMDFWGRIVSINALVGVVFFLLSGYIGRWFGDLSLLRIWATGWVGFNFVMCLINPFSSFLGHSFQFQDTIVLRKLLFGITMGMSVFFTNALIIGRNSFVLNIAPRDKVPTYTAFSNIAVVPIILLTLALPGWVVDASQKVASASSAASFFTGYRLSFLISAAIAGIALAFSFRMTGKKASTMR